MYTIHLTECTKESPSPKFDPVKHIFNIGGSGQESYNDYFIQFHLECFMNIAGINYIFKEEENCS